MFYDNFESYTVTGSTFMSFSLNLTDCTPCNGSTIRWFDNNEGNALFLNNGDGSKGVRFERTSAGASYMVWTDFADSYAQNYVSLYYRFKMSTGAGVQFKGTANGNDAYDIVLSNGNLTVTGGGSTTYAENTWLELAIYTSNEAECSSVGCVKILFNGNVVSTSIPFRNTFAASGNTFDNIEQAEIFMTGLNQPVTFDLVSVTADTIAPAVWTTTGADKIVIAPNVFESSKNSSIRFMYLTNGARLQIFDLSGSLVKELGIADNSGQITFDAKDSSGQALKSGMCFTKITLPDGSTSLKKFIVVR